MVGFFVGAAVATTLLYLRTREMRLVPPALLFLALAGAHSLDWRDPWKDRLHYAAGFLGLGLALVIAHRGRG
jgi:hypothetical protein